MDKNEFEPAQEYARQSAKELVEQMRHVRGASMAHQQRPLTEAKILNIGDSTLAQRVSDRPNFLSQKGALESVSPLQQAVVTLVHLDGEIGNGGFHQYFWNTQAHALEALLKDAAILKGSAAYSVIVEAVARATKYAYKRSWLMKWWWPRQFENGYKEKRFDDLDDRYDALSPSPVELLGPIIRQN